MTRWVLFCAAFTLSASLGAACTSDVGPALETNAPSTLESRLPVDTDTFPSQLHVTERDRTVSPSDVDTCATCHSDVAEQWKTSAHFFASFDNPIYRASVLRFRKERTNEKSRFCGGCHDPSLMVDGAMDHEIPSDDLRAFSGVTCRTCHGATYARPDGNGSLDLRIAPIELPKDGDAASVARHKIAATPAALRTTSLCVSCHRVFLDEGTGNAHHLAGQDDGTPWMRSAFAGSQGERVDENVPARDCRGCHMPKEDSTLGDAAAKNGKITSHRFLGGHSWLASMRGDAAQLERIKQLLATAATIDVVPVSSGERIIVDVVVKNTGTGHRFPGGTLDAQDTWVEVTATDARGRLVATAGASHAKGEAMFTPDTHVLRAVILDDHGKPVIARETELFRTVVVNHTIAPRDAEVSEYALDVPHDAALPIRFEAKLRHRSRNLAVQASACAHSKTAESRAFDAGFVKNYAFAKALDPCTVQPIIDVAAATADVGAAPLPRTLDFDRAYAWGQGLLHVMSERLDEAREPLILADAAARNPREHAMALALLGQLAAKQGRVDDAFGRLAEAQKAIGTHPFFDRVRGEALASVWRETEAMPYLCDAAAALPRDDGLYSQLSVALGSAGQSLAAFEAARYALALQPRDENALRVQALSLESIGAPPDQVRRAKDAWLLRRTADDGSAIKGQCSKNIPGCAAERDPVRLHVMTLR